MAANPKPVSESNIRQLTTSGSPYVQPYSPPQSYPTYTYPYWTIQQVQDPDAGRLRFALELISEGGLTKEAIEKIAKRALLKGPKK